MIAIIYNGQLPIRVINYCYQFDDRRKFPRFERSFANAILYTRFLHRRDTDWIQFRAEIRLRTNAQNTVTAEWHRTRTLKHRAGELVRKWYITIVIYNLVPRGILHQFRPPTRKRNSRQVDLTGAGAIPKRRLFRESCAHHGGRIPQGFNTDTFFSLSFYPPPAPRAPLVLLVCYILVFVFIMRMKLCFSLVSARYKFSCYSTFPSNDPCARLSLSLSFSLLDLFPLRLRSSCTRLRVRIP